MDTNQLDKGNVDAINVIKQMKCGKVVETDWEWLLACPSRR